MKKSTVIWLITAAALVLIGLAVFAGAMATLRWDFSRLSNMRYETNTFEIGDAFDDLLIDVKTDDVIFKLSDDHQCKVVCYEQEKLKHTAVVENKTLTITATDTRKWYEHIGLFAFDNPKTTVYLPQKSYGSLSVKTDTGDIEIPGDFTFNSVDIAGATGDVTYGASSTGSTTIALSTGDITVNGASSGEMRLSASTGDIRVGASSCEGDISVKVSTGDAVLNDVKCKSLVSDGSTGDILLKNAVASRSFSLERSTGDVTLESCDASELFIKTSTGDVTGALLSEKVFFTDTSTGSVNVPKTAEGGKCEITTSTGDIRIVIQDKNK